MIASKALNEYLPLKQGLRRPELFFYSGVTVSMSIFH